MYSVLTSIGQEHAHHNKTSKCKCKSSLHEINKQSWKTNVTIVPKLKTFIKYKDEYLPET